jgi:peptide-methionine (S)-S-oxide reductase
MSLSGTPAVATLAGGCFWCIEAVFERLQGVRSVQSGYTGGAQANPTYREVCSGATGHAEAIRVTFDPTVITYRTLLELFFAFHDPTTLNQQGPDLGTQYRSAIFTHGPDQEATAREVIATLTREGTFADPIVTEVTPATTWYPAEAQHQEYYRRNPNQPYCAALIGPKVGKLRARYAGLLRDATPSP